MVGSRATKQRTAVKVCGVRRVEDAIACRELGVDAIGINFWEGSSRYCAIDDARRIVCAAKGLMTVGVFVNASVDKIGLIKEDVGLDCVQLHGDETPEELSVLLPHAYKALAHTADLPDRAAMFGGDYLLIDSHVPGVRGGSGISWNWGKVAPLASERKIILAGGLSVDNVAAAVSAVQPFAVDVASGVEVEPGVKDHKGIELLVQQVRSASRWRGDVSAKG